MKTSATNFIFKISIFSMVTFLLLFTTTAITPSLSTQKQHNTLASTFTSDTIPCLQSSTFYQVLEGNQFVSYNPYTAEFNIIFTNSYEINAIGYNVEDHYIYGIRRSSNHLVRVGATGVFQDLGPISGLPNPSGSGYFTGDCNLSGSLFITNTYLEKIYEIDIDAQTVVNIYNISTPLNAADFSYIPQEGKFYGATNDGGKLVSFDPATGNISFNSGLNPALSCAFNSGYGASFADSDNNLYVFCNSDGTLFKIDLNTLSAELLQSTSVELTSNDGASCPLAEGLPDPCDSVLTTSTPSGSIQDTCCFLLTLHSFISDFFSSVELTGLEGVEILPMISLNGWEFNEYSESPSTILDAPNGSAPTGEYLYTRICITNFEEEQNPQISFTYTGLNGAVICTDTLEFTCDLTTQVLLAPTSENSPQPALYPNPTQKSITLKFPSPPAISLHLSLWNIQGQKILEHDFPSGNIIYKLNIEELPAGLYIIKISNNKTMNWYSKIIKQ